MSLRFWLDLLRPVPRLPVDPVEHVGDPDDTPGVVEVAGRGGPAPVRLAAEDQAAIVERLDVEAERRPWDRACIDGQPDRRCDAGDALTDLIGAQKDLERRITDLERQAADLRAAADHIKHETKECQS